jgi:hypothetical protein
MHSDGQGQEPDWISYNVLWRFEHFESGGRASGAAERTAELILALTPNLYRTQTARMLTGQRDTSVFKEI